MSFWILSIIMAAAGLLLLTPALLNRRTVKLGDDREQNITIARERMQELKAELQAGTLTEDTYQQTLVELEKSLLIDVADIETISEKTSTRTARMMWIAVLVVVPVLSFGMYSMLGSPQYLDVVGPGKHPASPPSPATTTAGELPSMEEMISGLKKKIAENPKDPDGWYLLGRLYAAKEQFSDSVKAYEKLVEVTGRIPNALVVLADSVAMTQGGDLSGRPQQLITEALDKEPSNSTALWMAGQAAADKKQYIEAIDYWQRAALDLQEHKEMLGELNSMITEAVVLAKEAGMEVPEINLPEPPLSASISIDVTIDPSLLDKIQENDVLYIFARAVSGPPMPLAAIKRKASELPLTIVLDDSSLLRPDISLVDYKELKIAARISHSGQPVAQPGDLQSQAQLVSPASNPEVILKIDELVP
ncbi:MAG: c-type cytochrome biogenesis protein CcmI [Gammaproteobacteria bacterium]|nr:MAG: c-type cytochrome biogenesis protein CcmI [Gammaproteobacteria bacterium]